MQMARRMLDVLERNDVFKRNNKEHESWRRATLCAALLHDVGHGPFSHVFEDVSETLGIKTRHESYTQKIIGEGEIAEILKKGEVFEKVTSLFDEEAGATAYSCIISSQFDADRLDFLMRDRHFTGLRSVAIDVEWLLDSLRIEEVLMDLDSSVMAYSFVFNQKGIAAIEEYFSAYSKMYSNVYFHKTTRAVQFMVQDILVSIFGPNSTEPPPDGPLTDYFRAAPEPTLQQYLELDDASVLECIKRTARSDSGSASALSKRFLSRDLYKCYSLPEGSQNDPPRIRIAKFISVLKEKEIFHHLDLAPSKGYKQYRVREPGFLKNVLVRSDSDNEIRAVFKLSPVIGQLVADPPIRFYFKNQLDCDKARYLWSATKA